MLRKVCAFCGKLCTESNPCDCEDVKLENLSEKIKSFTPVRKALDEQLDQDRFELFYKRIRETFELLYRFAFFSIVAFFAVNLVLMLMSLTFIFLLLTVNHVLVPLARTAGLY